MCIRDRQYTFSNINVSNNNSVLTNDHAYPYISRGGNQSLNNTEVRDYFPCFYMKAIIDQCMTALGYKVESNFMNAIGSDIKKLMCDLNSDMKVAQSVIDLSKTRAELTSDLVDYGDEVRFVFDDDTNVPNQDNNNNYNPTTGVYTVPSTGRYNVTVQIITDDWLVSGISDRPIDITLAAGTGLSLGTNTFAQDVVTKSIST